MSTNPRSTRSEIFVEILLKKPQQIKINDDSIPEEILLRRYLPTKPVVLVVPFDKVGAKSYQIDKVEDRGKTDHLQFLLIRNWMHDGVVQMEESKAIGRLWLVRLRHCVLLFMERMLGAAMRRRRRRKFRRRRKKTRLGLETILRPWKRNEEAWDPTISRLLLSILDLERSILHLVNLNLDEFVYKRSGWEGFFPMLLNFELSYIYLCIAISLKLHYWRPFQVESKVDKMPFSVKNKKKSSMKVLCSDTQYSKELDECASGHAHSIPSPTKVDKTFKGRASNQPFEAGPSGVKENILQLREISLFAFALGIAIEASRLRQKLRNDWQLKEEFERINKVFATAEFRLWSINNLNVEKSYLWNYQIPATKKENVNSSLEIFRPTITQEDTCIYFADAIWTTSP